MKNIIFPIAIIFFLFIFTSCSHDKHQQQKEHPAILVTVNQVHISDTGSHISASGKIEAENSANISTRLMGYITSIQVAIGNKVSKGQLLATLSNSDLLAKKAQAQAGINQATAAYFNAQKDFERFTVLFAQNSATQKELDDITTRYEMAKAGLEAAKQIKNEVIAQFSYSNIIAPFAGMVSNIYVKEGDIANPGMPIMSIEGKSKLQAVVMVPESEISGITKGMVSDIVIKSINKTVKGVVTEVSPSSNHTGAQYLVKIDLEKEIDSVLTGMFVNVNFMAKQKEKNLANKMVLIPQEAITEVGQLKGVYVVSHNNTAILRWLRLGKTYGNQIEVLSGLTSGETYIVKAEGRLFNGTQVKLK